MKKIFPALALLCALMLPNSCKRELAREDNGAGSTADTPAYIVRSLVDHSFTPEFQGQTKVSITETVSGTGLKLTPSWNESGEEEISVYILKDNGVFYAGDMVSDGPEAEGGRTFSGEICAKEEGERYAYVYPSLKDSEFKDSEQTVVGHAAQGTIDWSSQDGTLEGLGNIMPFVWKESQEDNSIVSLENTAYVVKLVMNFQEAPKSLGTNDRILLSTMERGTNDKVFPKEFKAANLWMPNNSGFESPTEGTNISDSAYLTELQLTSWADGGNEGKTKVAYILCSSAHNLNVFSSKFRITVQIDGKTYYYSEFRSFPGQDEPDAQESKQLEAFTNGKIYRATRNMSLVPPATLISTAFGGVSSLLGMWNEYGKPYDPDQRIIAADKLESSNDAPQSLKSVIGTADLQSTFTSKIDLETGAAGTTNLMGKLYYMPGNSTNAGKTIKITKASKVFVTIVTENAWDRNLLGYYNFPLINDSDEESQPTSDDFEKYIVFPDVSRPYHVPFLTGSHTKDIGTPGNAPLQPYSTVQLIYKDPDTGFSSEIFPKNTFVGFFVIKQAMVNRGENLLNWASPKLYTNYGLSHPDYRSVNPFAAGDLIKPAGSITSYEHNDASRIKDIGIFGFRDNIWDDSKTAFATMIFLVSTSADEADALSMQNTAAFNLTAATATEQVVGRIAAHTITRNISTGITYTNDINTLTGEQTSYEFTMTVNDPLYGQLKNVVVKHGEETVSPLSGSDDYSKTFKINGINSDITISANTTNVVRVKALKASELNSLAAPSGTGESNYKLILHTCNTRNPGDGAYCYDGSGNRITKAFVLSPFWQNNTLLEKEISDISPMGEYSGFYWNLEKESGDGINDFTLKTESNNLYLHRGNESFPPVNATTEQTGAVKLTAEGVNAANVVDNDSYVMRLKATNLDGTKLYFSYRLGANNPQPIFWYDSDHVNNYGKWRVYKVWTESRQ